MDARLYRLRLFRQCLHYMDAMDQTLGASILARGFYSWLDLCHARLGPARN